MLPSISRRCQGKVFRWGRGQQTPMERKKLHHLHSQSCERGVCQHSEELVGERQQGWRENNFKQQFCRCQLQHAGYIGKSSAGNKLLMNLQLAQITLLNLVLAARQATHGFHAPNTREESTQSLFHVFTLRNCSELTGRPDRHRLVSCAPSCRARAVLARCAGCPWPGGCSLSPGWLLGRSWLGLSDSGSGVMLQWDVKTVKRVGWLVLFCCFFFPLLEIEIERVWLSVWALLQPPCCADGNQAPVLCSSAERAAQRTGEKCKIRSMVLCFGDVIEQSGLRVEEEPQGLGLLYFFLIF